MIAFRSFALRRAGRLLLSDVDLTLHAGWKVGLVGRNGCGKSSLFATLLGELEADAGDLDLPANLRIASVAQETPALPDAAIDYVLGGDVALAAALRDEAEASARGDHAAAAEAHHRIDALNGYDARARAGRLLHGLGFAAETHERPVASFSGGWRVRLNVARALMAPSDLLLLDEPTNHLDLDAVLWLEQWLLRYPGTLVVISHDREFLDGVCSQVVHLHDGRAKLYSGNYTSFERQRAEQLRQQQIAHEKEQVERAHLQSFIDRFKAKASKAKQAQSRMKRLEKLAGTEAVRAESPFRFAFDTPPELPSPLLRLDRLDAGYREREAQAQEPAAVASTTGSAAVAPENHQSRITNHVLSNVKFALEPGDRVALLGPNGAGKSTLVKTLVGELPPLGGERMIHPAARIGYFAQHTVEALTEGESPIQHLARIAPGKGEQELRNWLGRWNFAGERAFETVDGFSGGERARLALALIAWTRPNVLLLDEPTNHLDMDMREALAEALAEFDGALVLVSHDRHLIGLACDRFWRVSDGSVTAFDGDLDDYAAWLRSRERTEQKSASGPAPASAEPATSGGGKERRRSAAEQRERERPLRNRLKQVEAGMAKLDAELAALESQLADPELYADGGKRAAELARQQSSLRERHAAAEAEWLELYEALEALGV
ncbi:ribosomal protection-like ABC-F family protein [Pseudomarimonas salicorniae]|uniref:ATP-binding cassette domain-containing protein n=1 Tax=Pseudomarimonas salicorniae TaxID=2933270 RepID=A0ABT0GMN7_9GAMM|nr:ATP-binding cassette domain-containing protein [Lysobacter sp. CAU 1642]MCK7595484.1 ATP-binding cassette domain-containing protein [Lysobacter sp. CAU 1642]